MTNFRTFIFFALLVSSPVVLAKATPSPTPKEVIVDGLIQRPPPPPRDQVLAGIKKFKAACLEARREFLLKYPGVTEDPNMTCQCMANGLEYKNLLSFIADGYAYYGTDPASEKQRRKKEDMGLDHIWELERNCIADPTWKIETDPPANLEQRLKEIEAQKKKGR